VNIGQNLHPKYPAADSFAIESVINVVDGNLIDESKTCFLASIDTFFFFVETISNEKECRKGINELMMHFGTNAFLESNKKECRKGIRESMSCFGNNAFSKSNKKTQSIV
jgi:hypothetical protein